MKTNYFRRVTAQTPTRFWINNATREEADLAIAAGATGCTQNPSYVWKMLNHPIEKEYALSLLDKAVGETEDDAEVVVRVQRSLVEGIAAKFLPMYEASRGREGFVSIQGDPLEEDKDTMIEQARFNRKAGPNIMAKIPVTVEGIHAIRDLLAEGVPINATEVMAVRQAMDVADTYLEVAKGNWTMPVAYYSHITGIYDEYLQKKVARENIDISPDALWQAGMTIAKKAHHMTKAICPGLGFIGGGARGLHHFTEMVGAEAVVTINWKGTAEDLENQDPPVVQRFFMATPDNVLDELVSKLKDFRRGYFLDEIEAGEYEDFGPVMLFRDSFIDAWTKAVTFVRAYRGEKIVK